MTSSFDLLFLKRTKGMLAGPPLAKIFIKPYPSDIKREYEGNHIFITRRCDSLMEVEEEIDRLKKELEIIRKKAKLIFYSFKNNIVLLRVDRGSLKVLGTTDGSLKDL